MIVACIIRKINFYSVPSGSHARVGNRGRGVYANFKIVFMRTVEKKQKGANRIKTGTFAVVIPKKAAIKPEIAKAKSVKEEAVDATEPRIMKANNSSVRKTTTGSRNFQIGIFNRRRNPDCWSFIVLVIKALCKPVVPFDNVCCVRLPGSSSINKDAQVFSPPCTKLLNLATCTFPSVDDERGYDRQCLARDTGIGIDMT
ncbi:unnamed protein product [Mesocestoides corti]|uniref:Uncharacterized protein n=1 Tax=Mesocestoides corti TaxID=53468 RepID=A0A0R3U6N7_MESCO|nr:unnamed protein product [Mesocestoides corti]